MIIDAPPAEHHWVCPNCVMTHVTVEREPHTPFHPCRGLRGVMSPMVPDRTRCEIILVEREDYVGKEMVRTDAEGRPVMSVITKRDEGEDCAVFAPTATIKGEGNGLE